MLGQLLLAAEALQARRAQVGALRGRGNIQAHLRGVDPLRMQLQGGGGGGGRGGRGGHRLGGHGVLVVVEVQTVLALQRLMLELLLLRRRLLLLVAVVRGDGLMLRLTPDCL